MYVARFDDQGPHTPGAWYLLVPEDGQDALDLGRDGQYSMRELQTFRDPSEAVEAIVRHAQKWGRGPLASHPDMLGEWSIEKVTYARW